MGARGPVGVVAAAGLILAGCSWSLSSPAPQPAAPPVVEGVEVVLQPVVETQDEGTRGPRPTPTAIWDVGAGGWSYDAPELRIDIAVQHDVAGYLVRHPAFGTATFSGDRLDQLSLSLHEADLEPGDILDVHAFRTDVPGFPHEEGSDRAAGLSPAVEVVVPPY